MGQWLCAVRRRRQRRARLQHVALVAVQLPRAFQLQPPHVLPQLRSPRRHFALARRGAPLQRQPLARARPIHPLPISAVPVRVVCARRCAGGVPVGSPARVGRRCGAGRNRGAARAQGGSLLLRRGGPAVLLPAQLRRAVFGFAAGAGRGMGAARERHSRACVSLRMRDYV